MENHEKNKIERSALRWFHTPAVHQPSMVLGFTGWMDGGNVSSGTVDYLRVRFGAMPFASIEPDGFYIFNMPGSMEQVALFRPRVRYVDGLTVEYDYPSNIFYADPEGRLILFIGKEPHLGWDTFAEFFLEICRKLSIQRILFVGSVAGLCPHTREPRIICSISRPELKPLVDKKGFHPSQYEGPASFATHLTQRAAENGFDMINLVAEIPIYLQGYNPKAIETTVRCVSSILELHLPCDDLRTLSDEYERRVTELVKQQPELAARVEQLEESYDNEVFNTELEDLKQWLQHRGLRLD